jgi:hypothetical protein
MLLLRLALGGLFVASSLSKLEYPGQFSASVLSYQMLPEDLARPFATGLPFVELFIGVSLVLGMLVLFASALTIPLSLSLIIANIYAIVRHVGGENCPCLGSLLTMSHSAALAIDFAMAFSAALLAARHRKAEWLGLGRLLQGKRLGLDKVRAILLKLALVAMCMVVAIAFLGVQKTPAAEAIDAALGEGRIVLLYRFGGDAGAISDDLVVLSDVRSRFGETVYVDYGRTGQDPWADRKFPIDEQIPTLFIITGQDSYRFIVQHRFEGPLDAGTVEAAILQILDEAGAA